MDRKNWAMEKRAWEEVEWVKVVWSDEKKFKSDDPDGLAVKSQDYREPKQTFSKRQKGGERNMVWTAFSGTTKTDLVVLEGSQNSTKYMHTLQEYLVPFAEDLLDSWTIMHVGAPFHGYNCQKMV